MARIRRYQDFTLAIKPLPQSNRQVPNCVDALFDLGGAAARRG